MATSVAPYFRLQFFLNDGAPAAGGSLTFYASGTTTPLNTYSDPDLAIGHVNPNPLVLNSAGRPEVSGTEVNVYLTAALYDILLKNSSGTTIWTAAKVYADAPATIPTTFAIGDLLYADSTSSLARLADVAAGKYLRAGGVATAPLWSTLVLPNTATANRIPYATSTNTWGDASGFTFNGTTFAIPGPADFSAAAAGQIVFPATQNASANANTLDDYEEGAWTPVIGGSGGTSGQAYTTQTGRYVKIGRLVICTFYVILSTEGTITGSAQIQGVPFDPGAASGGGSISVTFFDAMQSSLAWMGGLFSGAAGQWTLYGRTAGATTASALTATDIAATTVLSGCVCVNV